MLVKGITGQAIDCIQYMVLSISQNIAVPNKETSYKIIKRKKYWD